MPLDMHILCKYRLERAEEDLLAAENIVPLLHILISFMFIQENLTKRHTKLLLNA